MRGEKRGVGAGEDGVFSAARVVVGWQAGYKSEAGGRRSASGAADEPMNR